MSIWRKVLGLVAAKLPEPKLNQIIVVDDEDVLHTFSVESADFNVYQLDGFFWFTVNIESGSKVSPDINSEYLVSTEINIPYKSDPSNKLYCGSTIKFESYDEELGNLTNMFHYAHLPIDGQISIENQSETQLTIKITGTYDHAPVSVYANLVRNEKRIRSFD